MSRNGLLISSICRYCKGTARDLPNQTKTRSFSTENFDSSVTTPKSVSLASSLPRSIIFDTSNEELLKKSKMHLPSLKRKRRYIEAQTRERELSPEMKAKKYDSWARMVTSPQRQCIVTRKLLPSDFLIKLRPIFFPPDPNFQGETPYPDIPLAAASSKVPTKKRRLPRRPENPEMQGGPFLSPLLSREELYGKDRPSGTSSYLTIHRDVVSASQRSGPHLAVLRRFGLLLPGDLHGWIEDGLYRRVIEEFKLATERIRTASRIDDRPVIRVETVHTQYEILPCDLKSPSDEVDSKVSELDDHDGVTTILRVRIQPLRTISASDPSAGSASESVIPVATQPGQNPTTQSKDQEIQVVHLDPPNEHRESLISSCNDLLAAYRSRSDRSRQDGIGSLLSIDQVNAEGLSFSLSNSQKEGKSLLDLMVALVRLELFNGQGWKESTVYG